MRIEPPPACAEALTDACPPQNVDLDRPLTYNSYYGWWAFNGGAGTNGQSTFSGSCNANPAQTALSVVVRSIPSDGLLGDEGFAMSIWSTGCRTVVSPCNTLHDQIWIDFRRVGCNGGVDGTCSVFTPEPSQFLPVGVPLPEPAIGPTSSQLRTDDGAAEAFAVLDEGYDYASKGFYIPSGWTGASLYAKLWMYGHSEGCIDFTFSAAGAKPQGLYANGGEVVRFDPCFLFGQVDGWVSVDIPVSALGDGYNEIAVDDNGAPTQESLHLEPTTNAAALGLDWQGTGSSFVQACPSYCSYPAGDLMWRLELGGCPAGLLGTPGPDDLAVVCGNPLASP